MEEGVIWEAEKDGVVLTNAGIGDTQGGGWGDGCPIEEVRIGDEADTIVLYLDAIQRGGGVLACEGEDLADLVGDQAVIAVPVCEGLGVEAFGLHLKRDRCTAGVAGDDADAGEGHVCLVELEAIEEEGEGVVAYVDTLVGDGDGLVGEVCIAAGSDGDSVDIHGWLKLDACMGPGAGAPFDRYATEWCPAGYLGAAEDRVWLADGGAIGHPVEGEGLRRGGRPGAQGLGMDGQVFSPRGAEADEEVEAIEGVF